MLYRGLGGSGVRVSAISLGLWTVANRIWSQPDGENTAVTIIRQAIDAGITTIDTASTYGFGWCDKVIGKAMKGMRDRVQIVAKYGLRWDCAEGMFSYELKDPQGRYRRVVRNSRPDSIIEECEQILARLGTEYIDVFQCHWPDPITPIAQSMGAVSKLLRQGKVLVAGVSNFSLEQIKAAHEVVPVACIQSPYSMVNREIEKEILPWCVKHKVSIMAYSPFQSGLLAGKTVNLSKDDPRRELPCFKGDNPHKIHAFLREVDKIVRPYNFTIPQVVLNWTVNRPSVASAICGLTTTDHIFESVRAVEMSLPTADVRRINKLLDKMELGQ